MRIEPPRRVPDDEQKLTVLASLSRLGPCTELQLLQFLFEYDFSNYFEMMFALTDLCDRGQAVRARKGPSFRYEVTDAGREALALFGKRVPKSVKDILDRDGDEWKRRFRREAQNRQRIEQTDRGEFELTLSVMEDDLDMMNLSLTLPTREMAQQMADRWQKKAPEVYAAVIRILSGDSEEDSKNG